MSTKQLRQAITPTHILGSTGTQEGSQLGYRSLSNFKSDLEVNNVDNTSDANKPISTATQAALDLKAPINNPTFTGTITCSPGSLLTVNGNSSFGGPGILYPGAAAAFGRGSNAIAFTWTSPNLYGSVDNAIEMVVGTASDYRLKANEKPLTDSMQAIMALRPVAYNPVEFDGTVDTDKQEVGLIAHEVQTVRPSVVTGEKDKVNEDGDPLYQSVNYAGLVPDLIACIQEQQATIESLKERLDAANL